MLNVGRTTETVGEHTLVTMRSSCLSCDCTSEDMCKLHGINA